MKANMTDRREYFRTYMQSEDYKVKNREKSRKNNKEKTRKATKKRLQKHTREELMKIVQETCQEKNVEYESVRLQYEEFMRFLHDPVLETNSEETL